MTTIHILNGPNLNLLGTREPDIYGSATLADIEQLCKATCDALGFNLHFAQSNIEGELVGWIQEAREKADSLIINAGGYSHTSVAIHDALKAFGKPAVEVHLSNIYAREAFRHNSLIAQAVKGSICGFGSNSYVLALQALKNLL